MFLTHFVVAATYNEIVILSITRREADVFVRIPLVVDETIFDTAFWNSDCDAVRPVVLHLGDYAQFLKWDASCFDGIFTRDSLTV